MKKLLLLLVLASLAFTACKKDDSDAERLRQTWEVKSMIFGGEDLIGSGKDTYTEFVNGQPVQVEINWYTKAEMKFEADGDVEFVIIEGDDKFGEDRSTFLGEYTLSDDGKLVLSFAPSSSEEYEGVVLIFDCSIDELTDTRLEFDGVLTYAEDGESETGPVQVVAERK